MRNYEAVVIVDPRLDDAAIQQAVERLTQSIATGGPEKGEVTKVDHWGRRRLAYEIGHLSEGYYVVASFKGEPQTVEDLERLLQVGEEYVRHKIVRTP